MAKVASAVYAKYRRLLRRPDVLQPLVVVLLFHACAVGAFGAICSHHARTRYPERTCQLDLEQRGCPAHKRAEILLDITEGDCMDACRAEAACTGGFFAIGTMKQRRFRNPSACYLFGVDLATEDACTQPDTMNYGAEFVCEFKTCSDCDATEGDWLGILGPSILVATATCASFFMSVRHLLRKLYEPASVRRIQRCLEKDSWMVRLHPDDIGRKLGIAMSVAEDASTIPRLQVSAVSADSAVNRAMRSTSVYQHFGPVRVGDELIAVNGCRGSLTELMAAARGKKGPVETIVFRRLPKDTRDMIGALPVRKIRSKEIVRTCLICLEDMGVGSDVRTLPCMHYFHAGCSHEWLRRESSCPYCRVKTTLGAVTAPACVPVGDGGTVGEYVGTATV